MRSGRSRRIWFRSRPGSLGRRLGVEESNEKDLEGTKEFQGALQIQWFQSTRTRRRRSLCIFDFALNDSPILQFAASLIFRQNVTSERGW